MVQLSDKQGTQFFYSKSGECTRIPFLNPHSSDPDFSSCAKSSGHLMASLVTPKASSSAVSRRLGWSAKLLLVGTLANQILIWSSISLNTKSLDYLATILCAGCAVGKSTPRRLIVQVDVRHWLWLKSDPQHTNAHQTGSSSNSKIGWVDSASSLLINCAGTRSEKYWYNLPSGLTKMAPIVPSFSPSPSQAPSVKEATCTKLLLGSWLAVQTKLGFSRFYCFQLRTAQHVVCPAIGSKTAYRSQGLLCDPSSSETLDH